MTPGRNPERWLVLEVPRPEDPAVDVLVVEALLTVTGAGVEEREDAFVVYLPSGATDGAESVLADVYGRLEKVLGHPPRLMHRWQPHEAWEDTWRRGLAPRRITSRLVVAPSWSEPEIGPGDVLVVIDPGMAFGTAEHATTRGSLRLLDERIEEGQRLADIGAGSGILSIAAARLGADSIVAVEMDAWSCEVLRENAELNSVSHQIRVLQIAVGPAFLLDEPPFDGIVANIESGVLHGLLPGLAAGLRPGGWLILSGILVGEAEGILAAAGELSLRCEAEDREDGWWTGAFVSESDPPSVAASVSGGALPAQ